MKILSIGNSFSVDAQRWVKDIFTAAGDEVTLGDLYIGGCPLERHCENMKSGLPAYEYFKDNKTLGAASLAAGLIDEDWDVITLQQASHFSGMEETYLPYLTDLADHVRSVCPNAVIYIHQTWAYEYNSAHHAFVNYGSDRRVMHERLTAAYRKAAEILASPVLPVGKAVSLARENPLFDPEKGGIPITRDGFHLSYHQGRYLAGAVWYEALTGKPIADVPFVPKSYEYMGRGNYRVLEDSVPTPEQMQVLKDCAHRAVSEGI